MYYRNCPETPYLHKGKLSVTFEGKLKVLLLDVDLTKICSKRPNGVAENAFFVVDRSQLKSAKDWLSTDVGSFEHRGSSARVFTIVEGEIVDSYTWRGKKSPPLKEGQYLVRNVFYRHKKYTDFVRTATTISDSTGSELQLGMIEYRFTGGEHHVSPHKNPRSGKSFIPTTPSTRDALKVKASSHKGPSSIFDETIEEAGGIVHCEITADMPRNAKQISNARQALKEKEEQNEFAALLGHAKHDAAIRNMQWNPNPRVVFATDQQLAEIVEECCTPGSQSVLSIDTTYNVGDFYVTSTTYQSSKFIQTRTGKAAVLPGPAMFHVRKSEKDFKYFAHTLLEHNDKIKRIAFVGGDRDKAQQGFLSPLRGCTFLPCKKHVEDDITRKLTDLGLNDMKKEVLKDIFGSDKDQEKGIVDSTCEDEFVAKVISVADKWERLEQSLHPGNEPQFANYFRTCIEEDMKEGMLLSTRRKAGLDDEFFYNNAQECSNFKYKSKILEEKMNTTPGYRPHVKCTWTEALVLYRKLVEEVSRDKQRAVLQKGSFVFAHHFKHLEIPPHRWSAMTPKEKQAHLAKVDPTVKGAPTAALEVDLEDQGPGASGTEDGNCNIGCFEDTKLPECLRGSWVNANKIVDLQGAANHPNDPSKKVVISLSGPTTHTVQISKNRKNLTCDDHCPRYKEMAICCHTIAIAHNEGLLKDFVSSYALPLDRLVRSGIPVGTGKKAHERGSKRKRPNNPPRDVSDYGDRVPVVTTADANEESNAPYEVVFVHDTKATTCYGCKGRVRDKPSAPLPPAPYDLFIRHLERKIFNRPGETKVRISSNPEMVYYHPLRSCTGLDDDDLATGRLVVPGEVKGLLNKVQLRHLNKEFNLKLS